MQKKDEQKGYEIRIIERVNKKGKRIIELGRKKDGKERKREEKCSPDKYVKEERYS